MNELLNMGSILQNLRPSESQRFQQVNSQPTEERSRCTIMRSVYMDAIQNYGGLTFKDCF
ncbi:unnamed protein product [Lupinus luteus]|uniref:Uncharacterized protein n=1 Tax=Lupinus luteus TaxID=3873 RepID=A0AAV1WPX8_LUPLU